MSWQTPPAREVESPYSTLAWIAAECGWGTPGGNQMHTGFSSDVLGGRATPCVLQVGLYLLNAGISGVCHQPGHTESEALHTPGALVHESPVPTFCSPLLQPHLLPFAVPWQTPSLQCLLPAPSTYQLGRGAVAMAMLSHLNPCCSFWNRRAYKELPGGLQAQPQPLHSQGSEVWL